jgi:outer membrane beta-barrel protein
MKAWSLIVGVGCLCSSALWAQPSDVFSSSVERYQRESNFGPEIAVSTPAYDKEGKVEFSFGAGYSSFSSLIHHYSYGGSISYHFNRRHGFEPIWFFEHKSELGPFARREFRDNANVSDESKNTQGLEAPKQVFASSYFFNPYYAKMHLSERTVAHFDVVTGIGLGMLRTQNLLLNGSVDTALAATNRFGPVITTGVRFKLPPRFALRAELRNFIHQSQNLGRVSWNHSFGFYMSASLFFGSFPN